jgi:hypothetical protein
LGGNKTAKGTQTKKKAKDRYKKETKHIKKAGKVATERAERKPECRK